MATFAPHVERAVLEINNRYSELGAGSTYPGHGEDPPGEKYAADFWTTNKAVHDKVFPWLRANAVRLAIKYIISWERIWSVARASEGVRAYTRYGSDATDSQAHRNHIHVSFNAEPPPPEEDDMPTAKEVADELLKPTNLDKIATATAKKVHQLDGEIVNEWSDKATNTHVALRTNQQRIAAALVKILNKLGA